MGCDIHNHIEYKRNGKWICGDYFKVNPYNIEDAREPHLELVPFCENRNYGLFSQLAGVRNYYDNRPIAEPKGLPDDLSDDVKKDAEYWGMDGHNHSYLTLKELLDYVKKNPKINYSGYISVQEAIALDVEGKTPSEWCQATNDPAWVFRRWKKEQEALNHLIDEMKKRADELCLIYDYEWDKHPEEAYSKSKDIRLVFWFDN